MKQLNNYSKGENCKIKGGGGGGGGGQVDGTKMPQRQTVTKPKAPLQIMPGDNGNQIQGSSMATSSIRYPYRKFEDRNIPGRCVISDTPITKH